MSAIYNRKWRWSRPATWKVSSITTIRQYQIYLPSTTFYITSMNILSDEDWDTIVPNFKCYRECFQSTLPHLVACVYTMRNGWEETIHQITQYFYLDCLSITILKSLSLMLDAESTYVKIEKWSMIIVYFNEAKTWRNVWQFYV
jgi:hypothetical protein